MNKKLLSILLLMAFAGQSAQAFCGWIKTAGQAVGNFAVDVKNIVQPEVFTEDKEESVYFTHRGRVVPRRLAVDGNGDTIKEDDIVNKSQLWSKEDGADNSQAMYVKDHNNLIFVCNKGADGLLEPGENDPADLFLQEMKTVSWNERKVKKVLEEQYHEWAKKVRKRKLDNPWFGMRLPAFVFWAVLATGVTVAAKKLHSKFIKPRMDEITKDLDEDSEENNGNEDKKEEIIQQAEPVKEETEKETA